MGFITAAGVTFLLFSAFQSPANECERSVNQNKVREKSKNIQKNNLNTNTSRIAHTTRYICTYMIYLSKKAKVISLQIVAIVASCCFFSFIFYFFVFMLLFIKTLIEA